MKSCILLFITLFTVSPLFAQSAQKKVVVVTSNQHYYGNTKINAANHFAEIVLAYDVFVNDGYEVDIVSPEGGSIPMYLTFAGCRLITKACMDYIEGTANGQPDRVRNAFHEDLNLYFVKNDTLWNGREYIGNIKEGKKTTRQGKIVSIDYENDAAMAKIEILVPGWRVFTDY